MPDLTPQQQFSQNLRNAADWYDQHPNAPVPSGTLRLSAPMHGATPETFAAIGSGRDEFHKDYKLFNRYIDGDGFELSFYCSPSQVANEVTVQETKTIDVSGWEMKPEFAAKDSNGQD